MRKEDIKRHLKTYYVYDKRRTTISHAFASAIAPIDSYSESQVDKALIFLGQNPNEDLMCVFCGEVAQTWDHLVGLVKDGELRGYGHQIGNLVPCCKDCNSKKGQKEFYRFINESGRIKKNKTKLIELLNGYQNRFAKKINLDVLNQKAPTEFEEFRRIKQDIFDLMKKADEIAIKLRKNILA